MKYGNKGEIPPVDIKCEADIFENELRRIGVEYACEWFGYNVNSDFTKETIRVLCERSDIMLTCEECKYGCGRKDPDAKCNRIQY